MSRQREPPIVDPATHPRRTVGLNVAAAFLEMSDRALRNRIEAGLLPAWRDGRIYRIRVAHLLRYKATLVGRSS